eukprot:TRINITY_DN892_c0_g1_i9.p2 TRINITY_DN892_c0_g1~~TRINITY_DN892_c0_g1_i9.p2  ORF type:complete len:126 (+),score=22.35 TRINITY_DN892_c0_g1_i9:416-793(+)
MAPLVAAIQCERVLLWAVPHGVAIKRRRQLRHLGKPTKIHRQLRPLRRPRNLGHVCTADTSRSSIFDGEQRTVVGEHSKAQRAPGATDGAAPAHVQRRRQREQHDAQQQALVVQQHRVHANPSSP